MSETPEELPINSPHQARPECLEWVTQRVTREYELFQGLADSFGKMRDDIEAALNEPTLKIGIYDYDKRNRKEERRGQ